MRHRCVGGWWCVALAAWAAGGTAHAAPDSPAAAEAWLPRWLDPELEGRLVGGSGGGAFSVGRGPGGGLLFGVDLGGALQLPLNRPSALGGFTLGAEIGYQTREGLAFAFRYDDLDVALGDSDHSRFQFATFAFRYTFPNLVPMPWIEAAAGLSFVSAPGPLGSAGGPAVLGAGGSLGGGIGIPLGHFVAIDVGLRDWIAPEDRALANVLTLEVGITVTTGGVARPH